MCEMVSNAGGSETGTRYGVAGDQTGGEYKLKNWYNFYQCVLRHPNPQVQNVISQLAIAAANNDAIGYDQNRRTTYYTELRKNNWNPKLITTSCDTDCSASTAANIIGAGNLLNIEELKNVSCNLTTHGMRSALQAAGFTLLTDSIYLTSENSLLPGDVLLNDSSHVCIDVGAGDGTSVLPSMSMFGGTYSPLYSTHNTRRDATMREVGTLDSQYKPSINTVIGQPKLSVVNYTSMLSLMFSGSAGPGGVYGGNVIVEGLDGNKRIVAEYLLNKGLCRAAVAAVMGNIEAESGFSASIIEGGHTLSDGGIGLIQWTNSPRTALTGRRTNMINACGPDWKNNLSGQLDFFWSELETYYKDKVLSVLQSVPDNEDGVKIGVEVFLHKFEIPCTRTEHGAPNTNTPAFCSTFDWRFNGGSGGRTGALGFFRSMIIQQTNVQTGLVNPTMNIGYNTTGNSFAGNKYVLSTLARNKLAAMIVAECGGGDDFVSQQYASFIANLNEQHFKRTATEDSILKTVDSSWFASRSRNATTTTSSALAAVEYVLVQGNRALPRYIVEHDTFPTDILNPLSRSSYVKDSTRVKNRYGSEYVFWGWFGTKQDGDIMGYFPGTNSNEVAYI